MHQADWITYVPTPGRMQGPRAWLNHVDYQLCLSIQQLQEYVHPHLLKRTSPALDWETTGLNVWRDHVVGLCVSFETGKGLYVPVAHYVGAEYNLPLKGVVEVMQEIDNTPDLEQQWYSYRFDSAITIRDTGWEPTFGKWRDVIFGVYIENPNIKQYGLKYTSQRLLGVDMIEYTELVPAGQGFHMVHPEQAPPYACADADMTRRLRYLPEIQAAIQEQSLIWDIEHKTLIPIREAVDHGVWLDKMTLERQREEIGGVIKVKGKADVVLPGLVANARAEIFRMAGEEFNIDSSQQLGAVLVKMGIKIEEQTDGGQVATGKDVLAKYAVNFPIIDHVVKYKALDKQRRDYIDKLIGWINRFGPKARFAFNQIGAPTGRMSAGGEGKKDEAATKGYVDVNVQSIPDHEKAEYLPNIRSAFVANDPRIGNLATKVMQGLYVAKDLFLEDGQIERARLQLEIEKELVLAGLDLNDGVEGDEWVVVAIDYSQIELRVAANIFREPLWIESFLRGEDIHMTNARLAYRDPTIQKGDPRRKHGKTMNFATLYGAQAETVAEHGNIPVKLAQSMMDNFFGAARKLSEGIESYKSQARANKFVKTWFGRKRPLEEYFGADAPRWLKLKGEREAVNSPIQGGAADIFKIACFKVRGALIKHGWHKKDWFPVLFVHDELVSLVRRRVLYEALPVVVKAMEFEIRGWPVPIKADAEVGWNWGEMLKWEDEPGKDKLGRPYVQPGWQSVFPAATAGEQLVSWVQQTESSAPDAPLYNAEDVTSTTTETGSLADDA